MVRRVHDDSLRREDPALSRPVFEERSVRLVDIEARVAEVGEHDLAVAANPYGADELAVLAGSTALAAQRADVAALGVEVTERRDLAIEGVDPALLVHRHIRDRPEHQLVRTIEDADGKLDDHLPWLAPDAAGDRAHDHGVADRVPLGDPHSSLGPSVGRARRGGEQKNERDNVMVVHDHLQRHISRSRRTPPASSPA